ncbi:hypothetical protein [Sulfitobacter sp.]|uniref:hypothetical protein n=1 Tax=Sulfitobacter sp. TaxID=1903071 RepID=UPI0030034184
MAFQPSYDVPLSYGVATAWLRPSLRSATLIEKMDGGFAGVLHKVQQGHTGTLRDIVHNSATDRTTALALLDTMQDEKLSVIQQTLIAPAFAILTALMTPDLSTDKPTATATTATKAKPVAWADFYSELYQIATGWLGWTPDTAWNATIPEITNAFSGHMDMLKAIHGGGDDAEQSGTPDQRQANIDAGLDPEFDRAGLAALKNMSKQKTGETA